jgi:DNA (cytosine-5)-methyltransferase 1
VSGDIAADALATLNEALAQAEAIFAAAGTPNAALSDRLQTSLDGLHARAQAASAVFTNIITCLAIKSARPDVDVRYHQTQIQKDTDRPAGVNFRGISEDVVYPWLSRNRFEGAKSGWQTRTLERPKPYLLTYDENIAYVKTEFLAVFDEVEEQGQSALDALAYLIWKQVVRREEVRITLSIPKTQDIGTIVELFRLHFFRSYKGAKGASRLPVLALHAIYSVMVPELRRYAGKTVKSLNEHSAADSQTGSIGDIEVSDDETAEIFEAVEVKHNLTITEAIAADVQLKVMDKAIARYYILTTHPNCEPDEGARRIIDNIKAVYDCQVIANGVMPSIRYYLRLLDDPSAVFPAYVELLQIDKAIAHEHRTGWNDVVMGISV